jgi:PAS domain S-box-containing protein
MTANQTTSDLETEQLRARLAALELLQKASQKTVGEQAARLEQSLEELRLKSREQAASEEALRKQTRILQSVLDSMSDGVVVADEHGRFLVFNPAAEQIVGLGPTESTPDEWSARYGLFLPDTVTPYPPADVPLAKALRGESVTGVQVFVRNPRLPEGIWVSANARPLHDESGALRGGAVVFSDISARVKSTQRRAALHAVTRVLAEAASLDEAVPRILQAVSQSVGCAVGALWLGDAGNRTVRCLNVWDDGSPDLAGFTGATRNRVFRSGSGLPGRIWQEQEPMWVTDLEVDPNFPRVASAKRCGLQSAFGFPIFSGSRVTGVLEFFCRDLRRRDDDLLAMIGSLGSQIGQFMERKRAEEELRRQRERFELCVRGSGDGVWDWETRTNQVYFSPRWKSQLGYAEDEVGGRYEEWETRLHPEDRSRALETLEEYLEGKTPVYELEHRLKHKDGSYRWILARGLALRDASGRPYRMAGSHTDITDRKRMEQQLRDEEALYHSLVETLPLNILRKDLQGRFTFANQRFQETVGKTLPKLLGKTDFDFFPAEIARKYSRDDARVMESGEILEDVEEYYRPDGIQIFVQVIKAPVFDASGRVVGVQVIFWDVTERKLAEEELHKAKEAAEAANRAKSLFLANMSHEIRTPMNAVIGMTELALEGQLSQEQRDCLDIVRRSADHLLTVINDILDFSKIEAGKLDIDHVDFRLRDCVDDALGTVALRAHKQGLELACRIPPETPDNLVGDPDRLRQVLVNLLSNAVKFTERGEVLLRVAVEEQSESAAVLDFEVRDTGIGIPADKLDSIFAPFVQVDGSLTRRRDGAGLGLAISRRLIEIMGGELHAESQPGRGSRFHFTARFGISKNLTPVGAAAPPEPSRLRGLPVLIVDDNAANRFILEEILSGWRMRPTTAASGAAALEILRHTASVGEPFPLALVDGHMPDMDGYMLTEQIRGDAQLRDCVIVMLTSGASPGSAARRQELGLAACLCKPVRQADLFKTITNVLSGTTSSASRAGTQLELLPSPNRQLRILLAEDNPINQNLTVRLLGKQGHEIVVAGDGKEALAALARQPFDLILMDVQMPEMDGLEATGLIRSQENTIGGCGPGGSRIPIVAMTAFAMAGDREKCLQAGMDDYITKPVRAHELFAAIDRIAAAAPAQAVATAAPSADTIDWTAALDYVAGDEQMLRDLVGIFLKETPRWLSELHGAVALNHAADVKRLAHNLKGSVRLFGSKSAFDSAFLLEQMGRNGNLSGAASALAALEQSIDRLLPVLQRFAEAGSRESGIEKR